LTESPSIIVITLNTCRGNVRVKTFACAHPAHVETTLAECASCPDYEARE
jgi:hypothetical protein